MNLQFILVRLKLAKDITSRFKVKSNSWLYNGLGHRRHVTHHLAFINIKEKTGLEGKGEGVAEKGSVVI